MVSLSLEREVRRRAAGRCEYCHFPEELHAYPFHIEHINSKQHHGASSIENLALACNLCNLSKGPNIAGIDLLSGQLVRLYNPRQDIWSEHFMFMNAKIIGVSATGRLTVDLLNMNQPERVEVRRICIAAGLIMT